MGYGYTDLQIYRQSLQGVKLVHDLIQHPRLQRDFSLKDQIIRAAMSVSANIAEGYGRHTARDFHQFISIALGSCNEVQAFVDIISTIYPEIDSLREKEFYDHLGKQIFAFRKSLKY